MQQCGEFLGLLFVPRVLGPSAWSYQGACANEMSTSLLSQAEGLGRGAPAGKLGSPESYSLRADPGRPRWLQLGARVRSDHTGADLCPHVLSSRHQGTQCHLEAQGRVLHLAVAPTEIQRDPP